jgi:hypothetical protein
VRGDAAPWYQQVDRVKIFCLRQTHRFFVNECLGVTERRTKPSVEFQRADAAVDVDRRIDLGVARVGDSDFLACDWQPARRLPRLEALTVQRKLTLATPALLARKRNCRFF